MESFRLLKTNLQVWGVLRSGPDFKEQLLRITMNIVFFTVIIQHALAVIWFFLFDAQTFREYVESFFYICYALQVFSWYTMHFMNRTKYGQFFAELDAIIAQSKLIAPHTLITTYIQFSLKPAVHCAFNGIH